MSEIKVDKLSPNSSSNLNFGDSGKSFTVPNGVTLQAASGGTIAVASGATLDIDGTANFSGATVTLDNDELSGDTIDGGTISNFASTGIDDNATGKVLEVNNSASIGIKATRPFWAQTTAFAYGRLTITTDQSGIATNVVLSKSFNCGAPSVTQGIISFTFSVAANATSGPNSLNPTLFAMVNVDAATRTAELVGCYSSLLATAMAFTVDGTGGLGKIGLPADRSDSVIDFIVFNPAVPRF